MKHIFPLFTCLLLFSCSEKKKVRNDWTDEDLKGKVKSLTSFTYKVIDKPGEVQKDSLMYTDITTFNNSGFLVEELRKKNDTLLFQRVYKYDEHNNLLEDETNKDGKLGYRVINKFDEKNNLIEKATFEMKSNLSTDSLEKSDSHLTYKYNSDGKVIDEIATENDNPWFSKIRIEDNNGKTISEKIHYVFAWLKPKDKIQIAIYKYDSQGNQIEKDFFDADSVFYFKFTDKYDERGNNTENAAFRTGDTLEFRRVMTYDDKGNKTRDIDYNKDSVIKWDNRWEYKKYDSIGNWVESVNYSKDNGKSITERKLEYY
jgi:hypothetical protein